jgi:hypothetical protein
MTYCYIYNRIYCLLVVLGFFTSCKGQVQTGFPKDKVIESKTSNVELSKIPRTTASTIYDNVHCGLQDKVGNIWFGIIGANVDGQPGGQGVYRYDGKTFTNFTVKDGLMEITLNETPLHRPK